MIALRWRYVIWYYVYTGIVLSSALSSVKAYGPDDICTHAKQIMSQCGQDFKKYVKDICSEFKLLQGAKRGMGWFKVGDWAINKVATAIATKRGCSQAEIGQARILERFVDAGNARKCTINAIIQGKYADVLSRIFTRLKDQYGSLRKTAEIRASLIDLLHQEMMQALSLKGSKDWFCDEINRKIKKKRYAIAGELFEIYLYHIGLALFATYWFEHHLP
jgi:hypothetical protein